MRIRAIVLFLAIAGMLSACLKNDVVSFSQQLKYDTSIIRSYLTTHNISATKLSSGVWFAFDSLGTGVLPTVADSLTLTYQTFLIPNEESVDQGVNAKILLQSSVAGLQQALPRFPVGSIGRIYVPSGLAFGSSATGAVPANSNLIYLVNISSAKTARLSTDVTAITTYLNTITDSLTLAGKSIVTTIPNLPYYIDTLGTGNTPAWKDSINVTFTANILNGRAVVDSARTPETRYLRSQINGWRNVLTSVKEGSYVTILIPSGYGFGSLDQTKIPANSNLVYHIKLRKVIHH